MRRFSPPVVTPRQRWFNRIIWKLLLGIAAVDILWIARLGWGVDWHNIGLLAGFVGGIGALALFFTYVYREPPFASMMNLTMQFIVIPFVSAAFNYVTSTVSLPLQDKNLAALDHLLGFDWLSYVTWVRRHDQLAHLFSIGYSSAWAQFMVLFIVLFLTGQLVRLQHLSFTILSGAAITSVIFMLIPAMGGYAFYGVDPAQLPGTALPAAGLRHVADLMALRNGQFHYVDLHFEGIVTFPSFHTTFALLLLYAAWPLLALRLPAILLNLLLILSTPVDGGHYLIDVLGGIFVALAVILLARKILPIAETPEGDYTLSDSSIPSSKKAHFP